MLMLSKRGHYRRRSTDAAHVTSLPQAEATCRKGHKHSHIQKGWYQACVLCNGPEGSFSGLEVSSLLPGSQLILQGHALRALPPTEPHVTHPQHNRP